jgi:serine protease Do
MKTPPLLLTAVLILSGCTTAVTYKPKASAGPAKSAEHPVFVYLEGMKIPRPFEVLGTVHVGDTGFTTVGGSLDDVMKKVVENARQKGADAVQVTSIKAPDIWSNIYRVNANLLRFTDTWETVAISEAEFLAYVKENERALDPIEGIWSEGRGNQYRIAIKKDASKPGRDFVAFILSAKLPSWQTGYKKIDITRAAQRGVYIFNYFCADFSEEGATVVLGDTLAFSITLHTPSGNDTATFVKTFPVESTAAAAGKPGASGTGFLLDESGFLVTNWHVVQDASEVAVEFQEKGIKMSGKIKVRDQQNDLAIIQLDGFDFRSAFGESKLPPVASAKSVKVADEVFTLGFPLGSILGESIKYSDGSVSSLTGIEGDPRLYQISVPVQPGNSGGPLITKDGRIVGVIVSTLSPAFVFSKTKALPQNVNFAVKADYLQNLITVSGISLKDADKRAVASSGVVEDVKPFIARVVVK